MVSSQRVVVARWRHGLLVYKFLMAPRVHLSVKNNSTSDLPAAGGLSKIPSIGFLTSHCEAHARIYDDGKLVSLLFGAKERFLVVCCVQLLYVYMCMFEVHPPCSMGAWRRSRQATKAEGGRRI